MLHLRCFCSPLRGHQKRTRKGKTWLSECILGRPTHAHLLSRKHAGSGSRFDPRPQRQSIFHPFLGGRSESLVTKPGFPYSGSESPGNYSGSSFRPDQVLLSKNFHSRPGSRQKSLPRNSGVGVGGQNRILSRYTSRGRAMQQQEPWKMVRWVQKAPRGVLRFRQWSQSTIARPSKGTIRTSWLTLPYFLSGN